MSEEKNVKKNVKFVFIGGASGTGKTTIAKEVVSLFESNSQKCCFVSLDNFYKSKAMRERDKIDNFDEPKSYDEDLIVKFMTGLYEGDKQHRPTYSFKTQDRLDSKVIVNPKEFDYIVVEGIFALNISEMLSHISSDYLFKVYVDTNSVLENYRRRTSRDKVTERKDIGNNSEQLLSKMPMDVRNGYWKYIQPSSKNANVSINNSSIGKYRKCADEIYQSANNYFESPISTSESGTSEPKVFLKKGVMKKMFFTSSDNGNQCGSIVAEKNHSLKQ